MAADEADQIAVNDGDSPIRYTLTPGEEFVLQSVSAVFDNGNADPCLPCCSIYSQSGRLLSRTYPVVPTNQLAAGDAAEVSFIPF